MKAQTINESGLFAVSILPSLTVAQVTDELEALKQVERILRNQVAEAREDTVADLEALLNQVVALSAERWAEYGQVLKSTYGTEPFYRSA